MILKYCGGMCRKEAARFNRQIIPLSSYCNHLDGIVYSEIMEKLTKISEMIKVLKEKKFTGHLKIDFDRGAVKKVQKFEEILKK